MPVIAAVWAGAATAAADIKQRDPRLRRPSHLSLCTHKPVLHCQSQVVLVAQRLVASCNVSFLGLRRYVICECYLCTCDGQISNHISHGWLRGQVVERRSLAGVLSLSCARPAADG